MRLVLFLTLAVFVVVAHANANFHKVSLTHRSLQEKELGIPSLPEVGNDQREAEEAFEAEDEEDLDDEEDLEHVSLLQGRASAFPRLLRRTTLRRHNELRARHVDTRPLVWSDELATYAKAWAQKCNVSPLKHSTGGKYAESIANYPSLKSAIAAFYSEVKDINWNKIEYSQGGHFINMVYALTEQVGCYKQRCGDKMLEVCEYYPPATSNQALLQKNVHPLK